MATLCLHCGSSDSCFQVTMAHGMPTLHWPVTSWGHITLPSTITTNTLIHQLTFHPSLTFPLPVCICSMLVKVVCVLVLSSLTYGPICKHFEEHAHWSRIGLVQGHRPYLRSEISFCCSKNVFDYGPWPWLRMRIFTLCCMPQMWIVLPTHLFHHMSSKVCLILPSKSHALGLHISVVWIKPPFVCMCVDLYM